MVVVEGDEDEKIEEMDRRSELTGIRTRCSSWQLGDGLVVLGRSEGGEVDLGLELRQKRILGAQNGSSNHNNVRPIVNKMRWLCKMAALRGDGASIGVKLSFYMI